MPFVPINVGTLQKSGHIEVKDTSVDVVFGAKGSGAEKYAAYQYSTAQRHAIDGSSLGRILEAVPSSALSGVKGERDGTRYAAAYRYAVKNNLLTRFPGGVRWFRILMEDGRIQRRMSQVYANYLSASTNSRAA
jgi:hypothetical protein